MIDEGIASSTDTGQSGGMEEEGGVCPKNASLSVDVVSSSDLDTVEEGGCQNMKTSRSIWNKWNHRNVDLHFLCI